MGGLEDPPQRLARNRAMGEGLVSCSVAQRPYDPTTTAGRGDDADDDDDSQKTDEQICYKKKKKIPDSKYITALSFIWDASVFRRLIHAGK